MITREEAITELEKRHETVAIGAEGHAVHADYVHAYRLGLIDALQTLAAAGAFTDGRNVTDRLVGRFALEFDPTRAKRRAP